MQGEKEAWRNQSQFAVKVRKKLAWSLIKSAARRSVEKTEAQRKPGGGLCLHRTSSVFSVLHKAEAKNVSNLKSSTTTYSRCFSCPFKMFKMCSTK